MTTAGKRRLALAMWLAGSGVTASGLGLASLSGDWVAAEAVEGLAFFSIGVVGLILARRRPENPIGWLYLGVWLATGVGMAFTQDYARWAFDHPGVVGGTLATWLSNWFWVPIFGLYLTFPFLLFPDGHLPTPRWRWVARASVVVTVLWSIAFAFQGADYSDALNRSAPNPYAIDGLTPFFDTARMVVAVIFIVLVAISVASLVVRFRRRRGDERQQIK